MNINELSKNYKIRYLNENDSDIIYDLYKDNVQYYKYCPPMVNKQTALDDLKALPPNKEYKDKYYLGYFIKDKLIALLDLIDKYPDDKTIWIGLFMMNKAYQGKGIGSSIINDLSIYIKSLDYKYLKLAWVKGNKQSENFWLKNGFVSSGVEKNKGKYSVIEAYKTL